MKTIEQLEARIAELQGENAALKLELRHTADRARELHNADVVVYNEAKHEPLPGSGYVHEGTVHVAGCPCNACVVVRRRNRAIAFGGRAGG